LPQNCRFGKRKTQYTPIFHKELWLQNIFKIVDSALYEKATAAGRFEGAEIDLKDGFIHFSDSHQVRETARLHFSGPRGLMIFAVDAASLGDALKWEASRGGQLFPHLFGVLDMKHVLWAKPLPWNGTAHDFPPETFQ
jgi:uncharacterized protein (DUF952 family)